MKRFFIKLFCLLFICTFLISYAIVPASAKTKLGLHKKGHNWYYTYQTTTYRHKRGEYAKNCIKFINGKFYRFRRNGKMQRKDSHHIDVRKDGSIKYIYLTGSHRTWRYNTSTHRYQVRKKKRWRTLEGNEFFPYGLIEMQR